MARQTSPVLSRRGDDVTYDQSDRNLSANGALRLRQAEVFARLLVRRGADLAAALFAPVATFVAGGVEGADSPTFAAVAGTASFSLVVGRTASAAL